MNSPDEEVTATEGCAVISCAEVTSGEIICHILGVDDLPEHSITEENVKGYLWSMDTKYYTAEAYLYDVRDKVLFSPTLADKIRATIFYFDSKDPVSFKNVLNWMPYLKDLCSDVQLLVCSNCSEDGNVTASQRKTILDWCLKNQFELVELEPIEESDDETDDVFKETKGYSRIIQALHSHSWSNLVLKDEPRCKYKNCNIETHSMEGSEGKDSELPIIEGLSLNETSEPEKVSLQNDCQSSDSKNAAMQNGCQSKNTEQEPSETGCQSSGSASNNTHEIKSDTQRDNVSQEEQWLLNVLTKEDPSGQSFESLFNKFYDMKERATGLTGDDRKKYAEEVAIAFWRAMGGDEDEIEGLSD